MSVDNEALEVKIDMLTDHVTTWRDEIRADHKELRNEIRTTHKELFGEIKANTKEIGDIRTKDGRQDEKITAGNSRINTIWKVLIAAGIVSSAGAGFARLVGG